MEKFKILIYKNIIVKIPLSFIYLPTPININYIWNFGSVLGIFLLIQIISGLFLPIHYCPNVDFAFKKISHILKDVNSGWLIRLIDIFYWFIFILDEIYFIILLN